MPPRPDTPRGSYRCLGCRQYRRRPEHRRVALGSVCSDECLQVVAGRRARSLPARPASEPTSATRAAVYRRDRGRCRYCGTRSGLHLHHVELRSHGVDHQPHNLVSLCMRCHRRVHADNRCYQPVLRALIWCQYVWGTYLTVPEAQRLAAQLSASPDAPPALARRYAVSWRPMNSV